eukprot:211369-Lingulodinium_polyedra.AAC.1
MFHVTPTADSTNVCRTGLRPGIRCGMSGATELQCSPFLLFDTVRPSRTAAAGRFGSREHNLR